MIMNILIAALLLGTGGAALAGGSDSPAGEVLATRTVEVLGQTITLVDTRLLEGGKDVYCQQHVAGAYADPNIEPETRKVVVQIGITCQAGTPTN